MMKIYRKFNGFFFIVFLLSSLITLNLFAQKNPLVKNIENLSESGDILLISMPCYLCSVIENETDSEFSHLGIILKTDTGTFVLDSTGKVQKTKLSAFVDKAKKFSFLKLIRSKQANLLPDSFIMNLVFRVDFEGAPYDPYFLVDNKIGKRTALYCSEFVKEYFDAFGIKTPDYQPMTFTKNLDIWQKYYEGIKYEIPEGEPGINPESFNQSNLYKSIKSFYKP